MAEQDIAPVETTAPEAPIADVARDTGPPAADSSAPPEKSAKLSLRDQIKQNFKAAVEPEAKERPSKTSPDDRPRDDTGKFLPKDAVAAPAKAAPADQKPPAVKDASPAPASTPSGPPPGWSAESKALYATLPDPLKADILKREKEVSDGFKKYSDDAKRYQEIEQALAPVRPIYQQNGIRNDAEAVNYLLRWEAAIRQNPVAALSTLVHQFGINPASLAQPNPGQSNGQDASLQQYLNPLSQQVGSIKSEIDALRAERAAAEITSFAKDKPHFEKVKQEMGRLLQAGLANGLDSAYQMAIRLDGNIYAETMKNELETKLNSHQQEMQQRATLARKAAVSPSTRAPSAHVDTNSVKQKGIRGSILSAVEELRESGRA